MFSATSCLAGSALDNLTTGIDYLKIDLHVHSINNNVNFMFLNNCGDKKCCIFTGKSLIGAVGFVGKANKGKKQ